MAWSPITVGDGRSSHHVFTTDSGVFPLTGVANSAIALHLANNVSVYVCTGDWNVTDGPGGKADFTPSEQDLISPNPFATPGTYKAYPVVTLSTGPVPMDTQILEILDVK